MNDNRKITISLNFFLLIFTLMLLVGLVFPEKIVAKKIKLKSVLKNTFPTGCREVGFGFKHYMLILYPYAAGQSQSLYFIHNKTRKLIKFYQMRSGDEAYIYHLNNKIQPKQWGALATDEKKVKFVCTMLSEKSKYGEIVDCAEVLELCEYPNVQFAINNYGNYWAVESGTKSEVIKKVIRQGVLLRW